MLPYEIEERMKGVIQELSTGYELTALAHRHWKTAVSEADRLEAVVFLQSKAEFKGVTMEELKRMTRINAEVQHLTHDAIIKETAYKSAQGKILVLEREFDMLRSLLGIERATIERGIHTSEHIT